MEKRASNLFHVPAMRTTFKKRTRNNKGTIPKRIIIFFGLRVQQYLDLLQLETILLSRYE